MNEPIDLSVYGYLRDRDLEREGIFIGEGHFVVDRMIDSGYEMLSLLCTAARAEAYIARAAGRFPVAARTEAEISALAGFNFHRGVLAAARRKEETTIEQAEFSGKEFSGPAVIGVCPHVGESENIGSIIRSAAAFGLSGLLLGKRSADPFSRKAIRASMGTVFRLPLFYSVDEKADIACLKRNGFLLAGAVAGGAAMTPADLADRISRQARSRVALVLGNEAWGVPEPWASACDERLTITMRNGVDSLNVGVAAGVLFYALSIPLNP